MCMVKTKISNQDTPIDVQQYAYDSHEKIYLYQCPDYYVLLNLRVLVRHSEWYTHPRIKFKVGFASSI
ncbi:hypothetical protein SERLA73DRAFT_187785 [Serpula lacrymans var. lacrymans S7.3]|uniref:Uncharacterized protein n=2 Tax=Serpula lacrymans var. lacrymans TaxID=341189 RepID=F8QAE1_SERL3|nr:uncharacterized protein SERLADRAFT_477589 [Serpula lacrymans var. lacrymans S7.9]EGN94731.1 hypothetical protein SERLA73DRAFT_187785 [Serpula lacrymans var. lacrymans S7.3]EGO20211.1 hypothetical protein SERLADRAFT_477589 [Serpula lacrymans var. lacrymans S7.9]